MISCLAESNAVSKSSVATLGKNLCLLGVRPENVTQEVPTEGEQAFRWVFVADDTGGQTAPPINRHLCSSNGANAANAVPTLSAALPANYGDPNT